MSNVDVKTTTNQINVSTQKKVLEVSSVKNEINAVLKRPQINVEAKTNKIYVTTNIATTTFGNKTTDDLPEGTTNLYYTEARVAANSDVAANTSARHTHSNKSILDATEESLTTTLKGNYDAAYTHSQITSGNPHNVTKTDVGLGDVPNLDTTDAVAHEHTHSNKTLLDSLTDSGSGSNFLADDGTYKAISTNSIIDTYASDPSSPVDGQVILNTTTNEIKVWYISKWFVLHTLSFGSFLQLQSGDYLLLQNGDKIELQYS